MSVELIRRESTESVVWFYKVDGSILITAPKPAFELNYIYESVYAGESVIIINFELIAHRNYAMLISYLVKEVGYRVQSSYSDNMCMNFVLVHKDYLA